MHIQLATTRRQILAAYQIRYACLCQELGDYTFAQHQKARMCDTDDIPQSLLYVAYLGDKIVGTARLLLRRHQPFI